MKVALVHELLTMRGGAERVLRVLADMFPDAPIYTLLYDEQKLGDWFPRERVRVSNVQRRGFFSNNHHLYLKNFPSAVEAWDFSEFDLVISSSSAFVHGIITNSAPKHLCYVHSPARYLWDRTHDVLDRASKGFLGPLKRHYLEKTFHQLRIWDAESADRPDKLIAASKTVQRRIELYWRRQSSVIYPPLDDFWSSSSNQQPANQPTRNQSAGYLVVSSLAPYKRLHLAIQACNQLKRTLVIAGEGPAKRHLQSLAGPTIEFVGHKTDEELRTLYREARAVLFPGDEDFGLVPLESLSQGTPVIAYRSGGALETLQEGVTGEFFDEPTSESLATAMERFEKKKFDPTACMASIKPFSRTAFESSIRTEVDQLLNAS